jgi:hypothetical protein
MVQTGVSTTQGCDGFEDGVMKETNVPSATGLITPPALREDRASVRGRADNILM